MSWLPKRNVIVPIDFSECSVDAIRTAFEFVEDRSHLYVLHVLRPLEHTAPEVLWGNVDEESRDKALRHYMDEFLTKHELNGVTIATKFGDPGMKITEFSDELNADLIVMPSHGYHGIKRILLGSVAERVLRHADCQVLVLRRSAD